MVVLYNSTETNFNTNGVCLLDDVIVDGQIAEKLNAEYTLEFNVFIDDNTEKYKLINTDMIVKANDQLFRISEIRQDLSNLYVFARHISYDLATNFLEDVRVENKNGAGALDWILSNTLLPHNFVGMSDIDHIDTAYYIRKNPIDAILGNDDNSFVNRWGGEIERNNFTIKMLTQRGNNNGVLVAYQKNLTGFECDMLMDGLITRIMPVGKDGLLLPEKYVDSPYINNYANIRIATIEFSDAETVEDLRTKASTYFTYTKCDIPKTNYRVNMLELSSTEEYKNYESLETTNIGDTVIVRHYDIGLDLTARVISTVKDFIIVDGITIWETNEIELGNFISNNSLDTINMIYQLSQTIVNNKSDLQSAIDNASTLLTTALGGHVIKREDELLILDDLDINKAKKVWRWNINGLGYSSTGITGSFGLALTMDGAIVADFITTGVLSASLIKTGLLKSKDGSSWINMDNGSFSFANGKLSFDGETFDINYTGTTLETDLNNKVEQTDIDSTVNNIQIGGRNLVRYADFEQGIISSFSNVNQGSIAFDSTLKYQGTQSLKVTFNNATNADSGVSITYANMKMSQVYTISGYLYSSVAQTVRIRPLYKNWSSLGDKTISLTAGTWTYFTHTFTTKSDNAQPQVLILLGSLSNTAQFNLDNIKIEEGNKATTYSPAPEDIQSQIDTLDSRMDSAELKITPTAITSTVTNIAVSSTQEVTPIDDTDSNITYSNNKWTIQTNTSPLYNGTQTFCNIPNEYLEYSFIGTGIKVYTTKATTRGKFDVYIDNVLDTSAIDCYSSTATYKVKIYEKTNLTYGNHKIKIVVRSDKNASATDYIVSLDYFEILNTTAVNSSNFSSKVQQNADAIVSSVSKSIMTASNDITTVDDADTNITYVGTFDISTYSQYYNSTKHNSRVANDYIQYTFVGTGINVYGYKGNDAGMIEVFIDSVSKGVIDLYNSSALFKQKWYGITNLNYDTHTVKIVIQSTKNASSTNYYVPFDYFEILNSSAVNSSNFSTKVSQNSDAVISTVAKNIQTANQISVKFDDSDTNITYNGTWINEVYNSGYYGGYAKYCNTIGGYAQMTFLGTGIDVYSTKSPNIGIAELFIDGVSQGTFDGYGTSQRGVKAFSISGLTYGQHTVKFSVTNTKNASAGNTYIELDYFEVFNNTAVNTANFSTQVQQNSDSVKIAVGNIGGNNLIKNSSFEFGIDNVGVANSATKASYALSGSPLDGGTNAVDIVTSTVTNDSGFYMTIPTKTGYKYTVSAYVLSFSGLQTLRAKVAKSDWSTVAIKSFNVDGTTAWVRVEITFTATQDNHFFAIFQNTNTASIRFLVDCVKLELGDKATAWSQHKDEFKNSAFEVTADHARFTSSNGSYTEFTPSTTGLRWHKDTSDTAGKDYHYLTSIGSLNVDKTKTGGGTKIRIDLPSEFNGKNFAWNLSFGSAKGSTWDYIYDMEIFIPMAWTFPTAYIEFYVYCKAWNNISQVADNLDVVINWVAVA